MKRVICFLLLATLTLGIMSISVLAEEGDSKTNPVEIVDTNPSEPTPGGPPQSRIPNSFKEALEIWGLTGDTPFVAIKRATPDNPDPAGWALLNLILALLTIAFGGMATGAAIQIRYAKKEYKVAKENYIIMQKSAKKTGGDAKTEELQFVRKSSWWKSGLYDLISALAAITIFLLTEDIWSPLFLIDKWTPLMAGITAVSFVIYRLAAGGKKLSQEALEEILAATEELGTTV